MIMMTTSYMFISIVCHIINVLVVLLCGKKPKCLNKLMCFRMKLAVNKMPRRYIRTSPFKIWSKIRGVDWKIIQNIFLNAPHLTTKTF